MGSPQVAHRRGDGSLVPWLILGLLSLGLMLAGGITCRAAVADPSSRPELHAHAAVSGVVLASWSASVPSLGSVTSSCDSSSGLYPSEVSSTPDPSPTPTASDTPTPVPSCYVAVDTTGSAAQTAQNSHDALTWGLGLLGFWLAFLCGYRVTR